MENQQQSGGQDKDKGSEVEVPRGLYRDGNDSVHELIANATSTEDSKQLVVYREMFGEYKFWVAPSENFAASLQRSAQSQFTLVKTL